MKKTSLRGCRTATDLLTLDLQVPSRAHLVRRARRLGTPFYRSHVSLLILSPSHHHLHLDTRLRLARTPPIPHLPCSRPRPLTKLSDLSLILSGSASSASAALFLFASSRPFASPYIHPVDALRVPAFQRAAPIRMLCLSFRKQERRGLHRAAAPPPASFLLDQRACAAGSQSVSPLPTTSLCQPYASRLALLLLCKPLAWTTTDAQLPAPRASSLRRDHATSSSRAASTLGRRRPARSRSGAYPSSQASVLSPGAIYALRLAARASTSRTT